MSNKAGRKHNITCWRCGRRGHLLRNWETRFATEDTSALGRKVNRKPKQGHRLERRTPICEKAAIKVGQISTKGSGTNGVFVKRHIVGFPCNMTIDDIDTIICKDLAQQLDKKILWTPSYVTLQTVTGSNIEVQGKLIIKVEFGNDAYQHTVYIADNTDFLIVGLDFLKKHGFIMDFMNNELWSERGDFTSFQFRTSVDSIRQLKPIALIATTTHQQGARDDLKAVRDNRSVTKFVESSNRKTSCQGISGLISKPMFDETSYSYSSQTLFSHDCRLLFDQLVSCGPATPSSPELYVRDHQARFEGVHNFVREQSSQEDAEDGYW